MKRSMQAVLSLALAACLGACGAQTAATAAEPQQTQAPTLTEAPAGGEEPKETDINAVGDIQVEEELFDVTITIPADLIGESTQEELEEDAAEYGYRVKLNDDGSATYTMTRSQHKKMMEDYAASLNDSLREMVGSESHPNWTDVSANEDFTKFTVTTTDTELSTADSFSEFSFAMYSGMYGIFNGTTSDTVLVDFVNADTGELIATLGGDD